MSVDLDALAPTPTVGGKGTHGGYCGPAVKPIALHMVAEIARDTDCAGLPISAIRGIPNWRDAAEFLVLVAGSGHACPPAMPQRFKIAAAMADGLGSWLDGTGNDN